jgi:hypothetical protein
MVDQSNQFLEGIERDVMVKIQDHYAPADFMVLDMCKCNQAFIVGFGVDDHLIRGLMRFIEMTSRDSKKRMMYRLQVPQSFKGWPCWTQDALHSFLF